MTPPVAHATRRPDGAALVITAGLCALGAVLLWDAGRLPEATGYSGMGPADAPRLIGFGLIGLGIWTLIDGFRSEPEDPPHQHPMPVLWIVAGLGAQLVLLSTIGFSIGTGILFACTARAFGYRKLLMSFPIGVAFSLLVFGIFDGLLKLNLPGGPLETLIYGG